MHPQDRAGNRRPQNKTRWGRRKLERQESAVTVSMASVDDVFRPSGAEAASPQTNPSDLPEKGSKFKKKVKKRENVLDHSGLPVEDAAEDAPRA